MATRRLSVAAQTLTPRRFLKNDGSDYIGVATLFGGNVDYVWLNVPAGGIRDATHMITATPFTGNTGSGLTIGRAAACPSGLGRVNFAQNTFSTLDNNIGACDYLHPTTACVAGQ